MKKINKSEIGKLLHLYGVNNVIRYSQKRREKFKTQSVGEHITNLIFMAYYFKEIELFAKKLDFDKVIKIILLHDFGEVEIGDTPTALKTDKHIKDEYKSIKIAKRKIPEIFAKDIEKIFDNYENQLDSESVFVKGLDAMDGLLYWVWLGESGVKMLRSEYKSQKQFIERETYVFTKKSNFFKNSELKTMWEYYEQIYKDSGLWPLIKDSVAGIK